MRKKNIPQSPLKTLVYCGPTVPNVIAEGTAFKGSIPQTVRDFFDRCPAAAGLMADIETFPRMRTDIRRGNTAAAINYNKVKKFIEEGK